MKLYLINALNFNAIFLYLIYMMKCLVLFKQYLWRLCLLLNRYVQSWIDTREVQSERANLTILFEKYVPVCLEMLRTRFKKITPIAEIAHVQMLCFLLEVSLTPENTPPDCPKELYELYFVFACVWAFGGAMFQDQVWKMIVLISEYLWYAIIIAT